MAKQMNFKWIHGEELEILIPIVETEGWTPIHPKAIARVAFNDDGDICGFHILQLRPHAEPLWIRDDMRGTGLAGDLAGDMENFLRSSSTEGFIVIADTPEAEKLCKSFGMNKVNNPVYIR